jgi:hypothetical protein
MGYLSHASPATDQVEDKHDDRNHNENVDEAAADVEGKAKQPQDQKNNEDCPEHKFSFVPRAPGT